MELYFLALLVLLMAFALGAGYPVAFALPGSSIITILLAAGFGYLFAGDTDAFFAQGGPSQWLSAGVTNLRGVYWEPERDTLIAIPLFIFMGIMLQRSKIAEDLLITMAQLFGPIPGGLGISVVFVGALLAATTGIVGATVVAMGLISLPAMLRNNYSQQLATGTIAASGTLGQIIPPSIVLIILADQLTSAADQAGTARKALFKDSTGELSMPSIFDVSSTSAGEMFLGAIVPGLVLVGLYMVYILIFAAIRPKSAPPVPYDGKYDAKFALKVFLSLFPPLILIFLVLGSIIAGVATVNQAGAIGAGGALIMAGYRLHEGKKNAYFPAIIAILALLALTFILSFFDTNIRNIRTNADVIGVVLATLSVIALCVALIWSGWRAFKTDDTLQGVMIETAKTTSLVFIILLGAAILTAAFRAFGGEHLVKEFLNGIGGGFWTKFIIVMAVIFVLGFFLDFIEIAVVVVPIVAPILLADPSANVTAVWLGVMIGLNIQTSFLTPPFGFALFYLRGVAPAVVKTLQIYKGVVPFICIQLIALVIVGMVPQLVNYLPNRVALLSETAPPPRNPRLTYCVGEFVSAELKETRGTLLAAVDTARQLDYGILPDKLSKSVTGSFDNVAAAIALLDERELAEDTLQNASGGFKPLHTQVRAIEADMRNIDDDLEDLEVLIDRLRDPSQAAQRERLEARFASLEGERDALEATIPDSWDQAYADYDALLDARNGIDREYFQTAANAYEPAAALLASLNSFDAFKALGPEIEAIAGQVSDGEPADMVEPLNVLSRKFGEIEGASDIKSDLSQARRALRSKTPSKEKALAEIQKAVDEYRDQLVWREKAETALKPGLTTYVDMLNPTIGIRQQRRLTREQALFVASCTSDHRDISLNF
ncbi:TRAP transporter large permease [Hoeflea prorocentri]|uniref:TRAP transporter large permease subunit n=1 Tax=Hoeflea prorocentri TaxID=1922333 RepID=A0A9X3UGM1_9HYPH|nr:TRAP transporter large permease subunit [Hoeflea prorocentri]MCY6380135.1 TRAP transporter large permease subunit [Hoeflea prorocentri]MDA5397935.1 TRAP transporter large permease subunit [Hoeflea prorocentri]